MQMKLASEDGLLGLFHLKSSGGGQTGKNLGRAPTHFIFSQTTQSCFL